ncbi:MAG TPA: hypothetical protein VGN28_06650 [Blastococcus sp.]|nr:hypothetical protein [Blastococcus sp.]
MSGGVPLSRLLVMARLSAAQALEIGATVRTAAAGERSTGDDGNGGEHLVVDPVITSDGRVVLPSVPGPRRPVDAVLADLAAAVPLPGPVTDPASEIDRTAVRAELAALVRAVGGPPSGAPTSTPSGRRPQPAGSGSGFGSGSRSRSAGRRIGAWLLSILVLGAVVVGEVVFLRDHITADVGLLLDAGRGGGKPSVAPAPADRPLVAPAPAAAGNVAAVDLRPLARCAPGAACTVRLLVRLVPTPGPQVVTWSFVVVDRCTGTSVTAPGGTVTVPPPADRAIAVGVVALPPSHGVAVVAVTSGPAVAASPPVVVGSCSAAGQGG